MRDAKIHQDGLAVDIEHDVGRFDIAVDQAALVGVVGGFADIDHEAQRFADRYVPPGLRSGASGALCSVSPATNSSTM